MDNRLSLSKVEKMKTFVILSPVGPYYPRGFVPVKLFCDTEAVRAWPQGFGDKKVGGYVTNISSVTVAIMALP